MGELIDVKEFGSKGDTRPATRDTIWYFPDAANWKIEDSYPVRLSIHNSLLFGTMETKREAGAHRVAIRRFVRDMLQTDVVCSVEHLTHIRVYPRSDVLRRRYDTRIAHGYHHFHFEDDASAFHFKMRFGELCKTVSDHHPDYPPQEGCDDFFSDRDYSRFRHEHIMDF